MVKSLARGLRVLQCFARDTPVLRLKDIAEQLDIPMGSAFRLVSTLENEGFLSQDPISKQYRLGLKVLDLSQICLSGLVFPNVALPFLETLATDAQQSANMAVLDGGEAVLVARASIKRVLDINLSVGSRLPSYCTSMGKALLAYLDDAELEKTLENIEFLPYTPATITSRAELLSALQKVRLDGYAMSDGELDKRLRSVSAPVRDTSGAVVAAINIVMTSSKDTVGKRDSGLVPMLLETAHVISSALGYHPILSPLAP